MIEGIVTAGIAVALIGLTAIVDMVIGAIQLAALQEDIREDRRK